MMLMKLVLCRPTAPASATGAPLWGVPNVIKVLIELNPGSAVNLPLCR